MARNFPADTRAQRSLEELYEKELKSQINWFLKNIKAKKDNPGKVLSPEEVVETKVPEARDVLPKHFFEATSEPCVDAEIPKKPVVSTPVVTSEEMKSTMNDMYTPDKKTFKLLYDGISQEEKGRYKYLRERNQLNLEHKFRYPVSSSMEYGWNQGDMIKRGAVGKHRKHGRVNIIEESFYRRNQIPIEHCAEML